MSDLQCPNCGQFRYRVPFIDGMGAGCAPILLLTVASVIIPPLLSIAFITLPLAIILGIVIIVQKMRERKNNKYLIYTCRYCRYQGQVKNKNYKK